MERAFCDPKVQKIFTPEEDFCWNALLIYDSAHNKTDHFTWSSYYFIESIQIFGINSIETRDTVAGVSLRIAPGLGREAVIAACRDFNTLSETILAREMQQWKLGNALLLGAKIDGISEGVTCDYIWDELYLSEKIELHSQAS